MPSSKHSETRKDESHSAEVRTMRPANTPVLTICLNNCDEILKAQGVNEKVEIFTQKVTTILDKTMPINTNRMHPSDKPRLTSHIKDVIKQ